MILSKRRRPHCKNKWHFLEAVSEVLTTEQLLIQKQNKDGWTLSTGYHKKTG